MWKENNFTNKDWLMILVITLISFLSFANIKNSTAVFKTHLKWSILSFSRNYKKFFFGKLFFPVIIFIFLQFSLILLNFFMNWASNVAQMLINTYNHHYTEANFIFNIIVSMSRPRSIYVVFLRSTFNFQSHFHCH